MSSVLSAIGEGLLCWSACVIYLYPLPRQKRFWLRAGLLLLLFILLEGLSSALLLGRKIYFIVTPLIMLLLGAAMGKLCWKAESGIALYLSIWGTLSYLMLNELWALACFYWLPEQPLLRWSGRLLSAAAVYLPLALTVGRWMPVYISRHTGPRQTLSAVFLWAALVSLANLFYRGGTFQPQGLDCALIVLSQLFLTTILYLQTALFRKSAMQQELDTMNLLWHQQAAQYQVSRETIDLINRKCHDLKHLVAAMRTIASGESRERYLREIEDSVQLYDSIVKTGNETLDTVLTEKSLLCEASQITVNCVADGAQLGFMDPVDLYTILGNAMDNAMEAVKAFEQKELRVIDVLIYVRARFLVIAVTNPLREQLTFQEGLPVSIKPKNGYHGYGMRSIRHTVHKYGGEMTVTTDNGCFSLRLMIPLPPEQGAQGKEI